MSGVAGAERVRSRNDFQQFLTSYKDLISQFPGFVSLQPSGSYNSNPDKMDFGDIDIIVHIQSTKDKTTVKKELQSFFHQQPDTTIVPFSSEKHAGKRSYNAGELISVRYHDDTLGYSAQIDNIVALDQHEVSFKQHFLDLPAEKQGLVLGLVKIAAIETAPAVLFKKLNINAPTQVEANQEYEFNLSGVKLELRRVTYEPGTFTQINRQVLWSSQDWNDVEKLLYQYDLSQDFETLLAQTKQTIRNPRSNNRLQGVFSSMITVKSGEVGTEKGAGKMAALDKIKKTFSESDSRLFNALMEDADSTFVFAFGRFQPPTVGHEILISQVKKAAQQHNAPYAIFVSKTVGITSKPKLRNPLSIEQKFPYVQAAFPGTNFVACSEDMKTVIDIAKHINQKYKNIIMVAGEDRLEGDKGFHTILNQQNGIDYNFDSIEFIPVGRDPDAESGTKVREAAASDNWERFRQGIPSTINDKQAHQLMDELKQGMAPVARRAPQRKAQEGGYGDNGSPESRRQGVGNASYVSMPGGIGIKEAMLPKSAFAGSDKNKLGPAAHAKGKQKGPVKRGQFVGGGCEESVAEGLRGTGNPGMPTPYDQGLNDAKKDRAYDNPYDQPGEEQEHSQYKKGYEQGKKQGVAEGEVIPFPKREVKPQNKKPAAKKDNVKAISKDRYAKTGPNTMQGPNLASIYETFNSKQEVINYFLSKGKSAGAGAAAWERGWRGPKKQAKPTKAPQSQQRYWWQDKDDVNEFVTGPNVATGGGKKDYGQPISARYIGGNKFVVGTTNNYILTATIDKYGLDWDDGWYLDSPGSAHISDASEGDIPLPVSTEQRHSIHDTVTDYLNDNNIEDLQKVAKHFGHTEDGKMNEQGMSEAEGTPEGLPHLTKELLTHIVQQVGTEGAHAIVKSLKWGDGAAKELLHLIVKDLKNNISVAESVKQRLDPKCWKGYRKAGTKMKGGKRVNNCVPVSEDIEHLMAGYIKILSSK
jgi:hypothetical protein